MNKKAQYKINQALSLIEHTSLGKEGYIKVSTNTSWEHLKKATEVSYMLKKQGFLVYSEVKFKNNLGRCDLLVFSPEGFGTIIEVLHSESKEKFNEKLNKYPIEFDIIPISTKDNLDDFTL